MASLSKRNGRWTLQFTGCDRKRRTVRLGPLQKAQAHAVKYHVEHIITAAEAGEPTPPETARWLGRLGDGMHAKLAKAGLATSRGDGKSRGKTPDTLGDFLADYLESRKGDTRDGTHYNLRLTADYLVRFFGDDTPLAEITPGDADDFRRRLSRDLGANTVRRICGRSKQFFRAAVRKRLIAESPFADMGDCSVKANRERDYFISREEAEKVLQACPDTEWRLIFALCRFGGLRCPSELLPLTWDCVNWEQNRMTVFSPKTAHHDGREARVIPIFAELRPYLEAAFDEAPEGAKHIIRRYRDSKTNLRTQVQRIIRRAGLQPWPKPYQNLRATRETELAARFPAHVVCEWIGNTQAVAREHYLRVTDADFDRAASGALQNPTHNIPKHTPKDYNERPPNLQKPAENDTSSVFSIQIATPPGFEQFDPVKAEAAETGRRAAQSDAIPSDLAEIVEAWPHLPDHVRGEILAAVRAHAAGPID